MKVKSQMSNVKCHSGFVAVGFASIAFLIAAGVIALASLITSSPLNQTNTVQAACNAPISWYDPTATGYSVHYNDPDQFDENGGWVDLTPGQVISPQVTSTTIYANDNTYWRVWAWHGGGFETLTLVASGGPVCVPTAGPISLSISCTSPGNFTASWNHPGGSTHHFNLLFGEQPNVWVIGTDNYSGTSYNGTHPLDGITRYMQVVAHDANHTTLSNSNIASYSCPAPQVTVNPASLETPIQSSCTSDNLVPVTFGWHRATASDGSSIQQEWLDLDLINSNFAPGEFAGVNVISTNGTYQTSLAPGKQIYWRINTYIAGNWHTSQPGAFTTNNCLQPPPPPDTYGVTGAPSPCTNNPYNATLTWSKVANVTGYILRIDNGSTPPEEHPLPSWVTAQPMTGFEPDVTYYWAVRSVNAAGEGPGSPVQVLFVPRCEAPPPPPPPPSGTPSNLQVTKQVQNNCSDSPYTVSLSWQNSGSGWFADVTDDASFVTYWNKDVSGQTSTNAPNGFSNIFLGPLTLQPDTTYHWRIWNGAAHTSGQSWSVPKCGTEPPPPPPGDDKQAAILGLVNQSCTADNRVHAVFNWDPASGGTIENQWLDVSITNNNFAQGTYAATNNPPFPSNGDYVTGEGAIGPLDAGKPHFWRINTHFVGDPGNVWYTSSTGNFTTETCATTPPEPNTPLGAVNLHETGRSNLTDGDWQISVAWDPWQWADGQPDAVWLDVAKESGFLNYAVQQKTSSISSRTSQFTVAPGQYWVRINTHFPGFVDNGGLDRGWFPSNVIEINLAGASPEPSPPFPDQCDAPGTFTLGQPIGPVNDRFPTFNWTDSPDEDQYFLDITTDPGFNTWWYVPVGQNVTSQPWPNAWQSHGAGGELTELVRGTTYYWRVNATALCDPNNPNDDKFTPVPSTGGRSITYDPGAPTDEVFKATLGSVTPDVGGKVGRDNGQGTVDADFSWQVDDRNRQILGVYQFLYIKFEDSSPIIRSTSVVVPVDINVSTTTITNITAEKPHQWTVDTCRDQDCINGSLLANGTPGTFTTIAVGGGTEPPPDRPAAPTLVIPPNGSSQDLTANSDITFGWNKVAIADNYWVDVTDDASFSRWWACSVGDVSQISWQQCAWIPLKQTTSGPTDDPANPAPPTLPNGNYYWRVASAITNEFCCTPSAVGNFSVIHSPASTPPPLGVKAPTLNSPQIGSCDNNSLVPVDFSWTQAIATDGSQVTDQYLDLSLEPNGWDLGQSHYKFVHLSTGATSYSTQSGGTIGPLQAGARHYWRINEFIAGDWYFDKGEFDTPKCETPPQSQGVDLVISSFDLSNTNPAPDESITATIQVKNNGAERSKEFWTQVFDNSPNPVACNTAGSSGAYFDGLDAEASTNLFTIKFNASDKEGAYTARAFVDSTCINQDIEANRDNNQTTRTYTITSSEKPPAATTCDPSDPFVLTGPAETVDDSSPPFDWQASTGAVRYFFDFTDEKGKNSNQWWYVPLTVNHLSQLPSMFADHYSGIQAPQALTENTQYYWKVTALSECTAKKLDSGDSSWVDSLTFSNGSPTWRKIIYNVPISETGFGPDLVISQFDLSGTSVEPKAQITATVKVMNTGSRSASNFWVKIFPDSLQAVNCQNPEGTFISTSLNPGDQTNAFQLSFSAPDTEGNFAARVFVDSSCSIQETNANNSAENNNQQSRAYTVTKAGQPLAQLPHANLSPAVGAVRAYADSIGSGKADPISGYPLNEVLKQLMTGESFGGENCAQGAGGLYVGVLQYEAGFWDSVNQGIYDDSLDSGSAASARGVNCWKTPGSDTAQFNSYFTSHGRPLGADGDVWDPYAQLDITANWLLTHIGADNACGRWPNTYRSAIAALRPIFGPPAPTYLQRCG